MSYDPNRTTVLPQVGYPITEEIPAVGVGGRSPSGPSGPSGPLFLKLVGGLLLIGLIAIAVVLAVNSQRSSNNTSTEPGAVAVPTTTADQGDDPAPTAVELADQAPGYWQVVGVPDGLNVRSGPGISNEVVGSLSAGDRNIFGTGQRSTVNGAEWTQITFGDNDATGWVSSQFLAADTAPDPNAPAPTPTSVPAQSTSTVCFESQGAPARIARLQFADRTMISGVIRTLDGQLAIDQSVEGTLLNGQAQVALTNVALTEPVRQTWTFNPASVELGNGTVLSVVDCAAVAGQLP